jgi:YesN/AraC family two-component response regulator|tara:strand:- start:870 stop:1103 length:234 start_codon:yes stop_codon:yes gene_type:complete
VKNIRAVILLETDKNFNDFINHYRAKYATNLTDKNYLDTYAIVFLGEKCGFNSHQSFFRAFKKIHDTTPFFILKFTK